MYRGDIRLGNTIDIKFVTTAVATGAPTTLSGTPVISAYVGNSTTQITAGITLTVDFDGVTGLNNVRVVASSGNGFATASDIQLVITTGTVGGTSVVGYVIGEFSIENRSAVMPTTAGRTLDVSATGEAGIDWANIGSPTTAVNLSATNIDVDQVVASVSGAVGSVTGAVGSVTGNVGGNVTGSVGTVNALAANVITATSIASNAITSAKIATDAITSTQLAASAVTEIQTGLATPTNITAGTITTVGTVNALAANSVNASALATDAVTEIQSGLATSAALATVYTVVDAIKVTTDKLDTALVIDGAVYQYTANALELAPSGGLDAAGIRSAVGLASANLDTQLGAIDTVVDAVKVKTDQLTFTKANELDANIQSVNNTTVIGNGQPGSEWGS